MKQTDYRNQKGRFITKKEWELYQENDKFMEDMEQRHQELKDDLDKNLRDADRKTAEYARKLRKERKIEKIADFVVKTILYGFLAWGVFALFTLTANAFFWQNPVSKYEQTVEDYNDWLEEKSDLEKMIKRNDTKNKRDLFYNHCLALEDKIENEEEIKDARFIKPCEDNDIGLYFKTREGFTTVHQTQ